MLTCIRCGVTDEQVVYKQQVGLFTWWNKCTDTLACLERLGYVFDEQGSVIAMPLADRPEWSYVQAYEAKRTREVMIKYYDMSI